MPKQEVLWTALPKGRSGPDKAVLSVYVSPRLTPDGPAQKLVAFPDFRHWTSTVAGLGFTVWFQGQAIGVPATRIGPALRPDLWELLVADDTFVRGYESPAHHQLTLHSYPAAHVANHLLDQMVAFANASPTEHPLIADLQQDSAFGLLDFDADDRKRLDDRIKALLDGRKAIPARAREPELDHYRLEKFFTPVGDPVDPKLPEFDFHQLWSSLGEHPALERLLGIVIDLEFTLPVGLTSPATVWVEPSLPGSNVLPKTRCLIGTGGFSAAPRPTRPEQSRGRLRLGDLVPGLNQPEYEVLSIDEAGAAMRYTNLAGSLARMTSPRFQAGTPAGSATPAVRSGGMAIVRAGRADATAGKLAVDAALNAQLGPGPGPELHAEDLTRGWRLDIGVPSTGVWYSAHQCVTTFRFAGGVAETLADEGWMSTAFTQAADGSAPDQAKLSETIARWQGYSLSATKPGQGVLVDESGTGPSANRSATAFGVEITRRAQPGMLAPLRFGREYRFRLRAVDLAGNSLPQAPDDMGHTLTARYGRFEPVPAPACLKVDPITEGAGTERLVIRAGGVPDQRWFAPPKIAPSDAELMGLLDGPAGLDPATHAMLVARSDAALEGVADQFDQGKPYFPALSMPYLVHPWARGLALRGLPGAPGWQTFRFGEDVNWPDTRPVKLVLASGDPKTNWDPDAGVLTLHLPEAERLTLRYSSFLDAGTDLDRMGLWQEILRRGGLTDARIAELKALAGQGAIWMLTPYRTLDLVHAVRQPLPKLEFENPAVKRELGQTYGVFHEKRIFVHRRSTTHVDLLARWTDPIDPLDKPGPEAVHFSEVAFRTPVDDVAPLDRIDEFEGKHEFKNTKYHRVTYQLSGMTRFAEYFVQRRQLQWRSGHPNQQSLGTGPLVPGWDKLVELSDAGEVLTRFERGVHYSIDNTAGTITRNPGVLDPIPFGRTVHLRCLPKPITRESGTVVLDVHNTARPESPKVQYLVPAFDWDVDETDPQRIRSDRLGNYLQVYLDRPWYSSGAGELLGVVLWPSTTTVPPDRMKPFITQWGIDPIWRSAGTKTSYPGLGDFSPAADSGSYHLDEAGASVTVVGFTPSYDGPRGLWYCDIRIDAGRSYQPFVRLALARYQPKSVPGAHLSRVVLAEFAQLTPDRFATVQFPTPRTVDIVVTGISYTHHRTTGGPVAATSKIEAQLETRDPAVTDLSLRWRPGPRFTLTPSPSAEGFAWHGTVTLPTDRGTQPYRLVLREHDRFPLESSGHDTPTPTGRLTYLNTIDL